MALMKNSPIDRRSISARKRREQMRQRLIEAATLVFAERGPEDTVIDHIVIEAGVSRGSFYNYFRSIEELLEAAKFELAQEIVSIVTEVGTREDDPAIQMAYGLAGFVSIAVNYPLYLEFTAKLGTRGLGDGSLMRQTAPQTIRTGIETGRFIDISEQVAIDILEATGLAILRRIMAEGSFDIFEYTSAILRMFGVPPEEADTIARLPVPAFEVPVESLIARSESRRH